MQKLESKLQDDSSLTRADILDFFNTIKNPQGAYAFIHYQKNPRWDKIRLFFKARRNPGQDEHNFWHTATYQKAVKLLKDAYVKRDGDQSDITRQVEATAFIDYFRGNSPIHHKNTSTRNQLINKGLSSI